MFLLSGISSNLLQKIIFKARLPSSQGGLILSYILRPQINSLVCVLLAVKIESIGQSVKQVHALFSRDTQFKLEAEHQKSYKGTTYR